MVTVLHSPLDQRLGDVSDVKGFRAGTSLDAVKTSEPPGTLLPFSGQTLLRAGTAYLIARNTLWINAKRSRLVRGEFSSPQRIDAHNLVEFFLRYFRRSASQPH